MYLLSTVFRFNQKLRISINKQVRRNIIAFPAVLLIAFHLSACGGGGGVTTVTPDSATPAVETPGNTQTENTQPDSGSSDPATLPEILMDQSEPVSGAVKLSLSNHFPYPSVSWYSNLRLIGVGTDTTWKTTDEKNGTYLILAKIQLADGTYAEIRRNITVADGNLTISAEINGVTGTIGVGVFASSKYGVAKVEASFDGNPASSLAEPNGCTGQNCFRVFGVKNSFRFYLDAMTAGSGDHSVLLTMTDTAGNSKSLTVPFTISNPPIVNISSPSTDNIFANGTLLIAGNYTTDKKDVVTVTASLGDYTFMQTSDQQFAQTLDLSGIKVGTYNLTVQAKDSTDGVTTMSYKVIVTSTPAYQPLFTIDSNSQLVAAEGDNVLYSNAFQEFRVRNTTTGQEIILNSEISLYNWQISNGYIYASGQCTEADYLSKCIYQSSPDGSMRNLSNSNSSLNSFNFIVHGHYVMWGNDNGTYTLYDTNSQTDTQGIMPSPAISGDYDFNVQNGIVSIVYQALTEGSGYDIFCWTSDTQTSTRLTNDNMVKNTIKTDGIQVAWRQYSPQTPSSSLLVQPISGGNATTLSSDVKNYALAGNGIVSWQETGMLKVKTQTGISILASNDPTLYGAGDGQVIFSEGGKTYSWNATTGISTLRLDTTPTQTFITNGSAYFVIGDDYSSRKTVYRVSLD